MEILLACTEQQLFIPTFRLALGPENMYFPKDYLTQNNVITAIPLLLVIFFFIFMQNQLPPSAARVSSVTALPQELKTCPTPEATSEFSRKICKYGSVLLNADMTENSLKKQILL